MTDLISRQAAIDGILAYMPLEPRRGASTAEQAVNQIWRTAISCAESYVRTMPSAQTEIVRCKDCKHRHIENMVWTCPFGLSGGPDFYCGYGAEREPMLDIKEYLKQTKTVLVTQDAFDELVKKASAQPEIIRCKDCKWKQGSECVRFADVRLFPDDFCSRADMREEEQDENR